MLLFLVIGDVLGAGIYALVGEVGGRVGGAIWTAFLLALVLALLTACAYAELVTKYPQAAGAALYVNKAWRRPFFTFLIAFAVVCSGLTSSGDSCSSVRRGLPVRLRRGPHGFGRSRVHCSNRPGEFPRDRRERPAQRRTHEH